MNIKNFFKSLVFIFTFPSLTFAQSFGFASPTPFDPAYAADQNQITTKSIESEGFQLEQLSQWFVAAEQAKNAKETRDRRQVEFENTEKLYKSGAVSKTEFQTAEVILGSAEAALQVALAKQNLANAQGLKFKYSVLDEGNPGTDVRRQYAEAVKQIHLNNIVIFKADLKGAKSFTSYMEHLLSIQQQLIKSKNTTLPKVRSSEAGLRSAKERVVIIEQQINLQEVSLKATEETIKALP